MIKEIFWLVCQPVRLFLGSIEKYMILFCTQESEVAGEVILVLLRQFLARGR